MAAKKTGLAAALASDEIHTSEEKDMTIERFGVSMPRYLLERIDREVDKNKKKRRGANRSELIIDALKSRYDWD